MTEDEKPTESQRRYLRWALGRLRANRSITAGPLAGRIKRMRTSVQAQEIMEEVAQLVRELDDPEATFGRGRAIPVLPSESD